MTGPSSPNEERRVDHIPAELETALGGDEAARAAFDRLPASHRREYVDWIEEAKREETRRRRAERTIALLREGRDAR